jgi:hypothetical protein
MGQGGRRLLDRFPGKLHTGQSARRIHPQGGLFNVAGKIPVYFKVVLGPVCTSPGLACQHDKSENVPPHEDGAAAISIPGKLLFTKMGGKAQTSDGCLICFVAGAEKCSTLRLLRSQHLGDLKG